MRSKPAALTSSFFFSSSRRRWRELPYLLYVIRVVVYTRVLREGREYATYLFSTRVPIEIEKDGFAATRTKQDARTDKGIWKIPNGTYFLDATRFFASASSFLVIASDANSMSSNLRLIISGASAASFRPPNQAAASTEYDPSRRGEGGGEEGGRRAQEGGRDGVGRVRGAEEV